MSVGKYSDKSATTTPKSPVIIADTYLVDKEIGKGSFATVYKGYVVDKQDHKRKKATIAIKAVSRSKLKNKKLLENLEIEIAILKKIKHPHIVGLMDCERTSTEFFLVMEYCALGDLTFLIKKRKGLVEKHPLVRTIFEKYPPPSDSHNGLNRVLVVNYLQQLASALKFLRSKNLVHRDIKPQNLLLSTPLIDYHDPETFHEMGFVGIYNLPILKIADFGFARFLPNTSLAETLCGSPLYMAPEILNYQKYNAKADLWSVGTVLYEVCCGRPPFRASNHLELFQKIKKANDVISFPKHCELEPEMRDLICGLLTFDPSQRMGFNEFFNNEIVNEDLSRYEKDDVPDLENKSKNVVESNMFISEYLTKPPRKLSMEPVDEEIHQTQTPRDLEGEREQGGIRETVKQVSNREIQPLVTIQQAQLPAITKQKSSDKLKANSSYSDLMLEKEYVVVEKKSVEVNALADEFAHAGTGAQAIRSLNQTQQNSQHQQPQQQQQQQQQQHHTGIHRNSRNSSSSGGSASRRPSLVERRLSISSLSPSNALSKALGIASTRLFGNQYQQTSTSTSSPPGHLNTPLLNPQILQDLTENIVLRADHQLGFSLKQHQHPSDAMIVPLLESLSAKAFVIYSFAEVKFSQIIPLPPSSLGDPFGKRLSNGSCAVEEEEEEEEQEEEETEADRNGALNGDNNVANATAISEKRSSIGNFQHTTAMNDLPLQELYKLCTEAIVLYMKALAILARAMHITSNWWYESQEKNCSLRLNVLVQWLRDKFNECLEKTEFLRLRLNACKSKISEATIVKTDFQLRNNDKDEELVDDFEEEPVFLEKLIYDRALEISKTAAKFEMQGEFLNNCELAYATSLWMLESLLDSSIEPDSSDDKTLGITGILDESDKQMIRKYIDSIANRLKALRKKMSKA